MVAVRFSTTTSPSELRMVYVTVLGSIGLPFTSVVGAVQEMVTSPSVAVSAMVEFAGAAGTPKPTYSDAEFVMPTPSALYAFTVYTCVPASIPLSVTVCSEPTAGLSMVFTVTLSSRSTTILVIEERVLPAMVLVGALNVMVADRAPVGSLATFRLVTESGAAVDIPSLIVRLSA